MSSGPDQRRVNRGSCPFDEKLLLLCGLCPTMRYPSKIIILEGSMIQHKNKLWGTLVLSKPTFSLDLSAQQLHAPVWCSAGKEVFKDSMTRNKLRIGPQPDCWGMLQMFVKFVVQVRYWSCLSRAGDVGNGKRSCKFLWQYGFVRK